MIFKYRNLFVSAISLLVLLVLTLPVFAEEINEYLSFGHKVSGEITADNESDGYVLKLDNPGLLTIDFSSYIDDEVNLQLHDSNGTRVVNRDVTYGLPTNPKKLIYSQYLEAGTYYLSVNRVTDYKGTYTGKYELLVNLDETNNTESEPNNGTTQAVDLTFNQNIVGLISWNDSNDTYKVTIEKPSLLKVDFSSYIDDEVNLQLHDSNGTRVVSKDVTYGLPTNPKKLIYSQYLEEGTYYLSINRVTNYLGTYTGKYELLANLEETNNTESEPNNGTAQAVDLTFNQKIVGLISWNDSNDTYKLTIPKSGLLKVDFSSYIDDEVNLQIHDSNGTRVVSKDVTYGLPTNPKKLIYSQYLEEGTYYLSVNRVTNYLGTYTGKYELLVNLDDAVFTEIEPNNGTAQAQPIKIDEKITGMISWNDVVDTYELNIQESGETSLSFTSYYKASLKIVDQNGKELVRKEFYSGNPTSPENWVFSRHLDAGKYYIHVIKAYENTGKYEFTVKAKSGWFEEDGEWFLYLNGSKQTGWQKNGWHWYYLNENGEMQTGWLKDGSSWYYLNSNGTMKTGWLKDGSAWYYLNSNGSMKTGWLKDGGSWYFLNSNGTMKTGWLKDGSSWYFLNSGGAMKTGWLKSGNSWYFLNSTGTMKTGWIQSGSNWYYLNSGGVMQTGWEEINRKWYYFYGSGIMAKNTTIGGYKLGTSGAWIK